MTKTPIHQLTNNVLTRFKKPRFTALLHQNELTNVEWIDEKPTNEQSYINKAKAFIKSLQYDHN